MTHLDQLKAIDAAWMDVLGAAVQMQGGESSDAFLQAITRMEQARMHACLPSFSELMQSFGYSIVPMSTSAVQ